MDVFSKFVLQHVWHLQSLRQLVDLLILSNPLLCRGFRFLELLYLTYGIRKLLNQVEDFIGEIWSLPDELKENNRPIKEEEALVTAAAKQLRNCLIA